MAPPKKSKKPAKQDDGLLEEEIKAADKQLAAAMEPLKGAKRIVHSSGHPYVDHVMGAEPVGLEYPQGRPGGLIRGLQVEVYGPESSGKSLLTMLMMIEAMRLDPTIRCGWVDAERCFTTKWFIQNGGEPFLDRFAVFNPESGEHGLDLVARLANGKFADIIAVDSVAALVPDSETIKSILDPKSKAEMGGGALGSHARLMSKAVRSLVPVCATNNVTLIWINQTRVGFKKTMQGSMAVETTTGGNALKFYTSIRLAVRKIKAVTVDKRHPFTGESYKETVAIQSNIKCIKNKAGLVGREAVVTFALARGYNLEYDALCCAIANQWIRQNGNSSWYELNEFAGVAGVEKVQGLGGVLAVLQKNDLFRKALIDRVLNIAKSNEQIDEHGIVTTLPLLTGSTTVEGPEDYEAEDVSPEDSGE